MKIRHGFVSNSSSSSFLCIGTDSSKYVGELLKAENPKKTVDGEYTYFEHEWGGSLSGKVVNFHGYRGDADADNYGFDVAGLTEEQTRKLLETCNLQEAREVFRKTIKSKFNIDIPIKDIGLLAGEASSE
jgi:hypothetical protein